ncbi:MotA/TolQ/ExbB proton channel family protein [uncultured Rhodoblastus sp.]|uniref:MotA/TolQ/ExbB proton channel family protein n=1 Tax=uncultured Rhodoblastus sp. TaxID=543037 RepID=UPI0025CE6A97|nr:MotA/TolQ/ExbB proton channel family protein [uncultured Rhodoblastus sp.]
MALFPKATAKPPSLLWATAIATVIVVIFIAVLTATLPFGRGAAALMLDHQPYSVFPYPFTIQNITYLIMGAGLADLYVRWRVARREVAFLRQGFLPEDATSVLQLEDLGPIRQKVTDLYDGENGFLPYLIDISIIQLQTSRSVDQAVSILVNSLDLMMHRVDMRYQMVRYITWLIPTIGFIGTIIGIAVALEFINPQKIDLAKVTGGLSVSFYTTLVALLVSVILVFVQQAVQKVEEIALNEAGQYCLKNLINRIYIPHAATAGTAP